MKTKLLLGFLFLGLSTVYGELPSVKVTISDAKGKLAYEGATNASGTFRTGHLPPGDYVVQFRSGNAAVPSNQYLLVIAAGKRKVIADGLNGEQFAGGGVAMRLKVGDGLKIEGQVANERSVAVAGTPNERVINGRIFHWVQNSTGSNLGPHWEEEGLASARNIVSIDRTYLQHIADHFGEGSLLNRHYNAGYSEAGEHH